MKFKIIFPIVILSFLSCKKNLKNEGESAVNSTDTISENIKKTLDKKSFIGTKWIEVKKINNTFQKPNIEEEWLSFVEIGKNKATIFLMEPVEYDLDSIQTTKDEVILHIKNGNWKYKFYWIDESKYIGRWDYIYNTSIIDSSFSMYAINKKYEHLLN
ncbi:hypothetical protein [Xanthovirga aplysinae]|uniref:hypothetical protein n=1 Tax=Xanthovirga aplysinae TaxID=2529853 RepID=UPI0012BC9FF0|nr:hypothetical protein [Xanthovirga aplysinae]MTI31744.1 hypothetical protein [Xanthovirga aplysinae]